MDTSVVQSQAATATTSPSSPGAENCNASGENCPKLDVHQEDSKFKDNPVIDINMLTIEDSTLEKVPIHLENLLLSFDVDKSTPADLLFAIIYGVALENSFAAVDEVEKSDAQIILESVSVNEPFQSKCVAILSKMPHCEFDVENMSYNLRMQLYFDKQENHSLLMTGIVTGDLLILTLTPDNGLTAGKSICLSIGRYVLNSKGRPFPSRFRKLPELSYKLRENVLGPVRKNLLQQDGFLIYPCLEGLPEELYPILYSYLKTNNLMKISNVCKRLLLTVAQYKDHRKSLLKRKIKK